jgi:predicted nucleic acid-binding protein
MINIDSSVAVKWFKPGERSEAEALDLRARIDHGRVEAAAHEIVSLEVVRAPKNTQLRQPGLGMTDALISRAFDRLERMFASGALLECLVREVRRQAKDIELGLGLFMADALHLAAAIYLGVQYFVVDDQHFLAPDVVKHAATCGVQVVNLPDLLAALTRGGGKASPPSPRWDLERDSSGQQTLVSGLLFPWASPCTVARRPVNNCPPGTALPKNVYS